MKANLLAWLDSDRNDARVALTVGLEENIHDGLIDTLRKVYKQLSNPHEKAVVTGGMHTAASTRWGGTQEIVDEAGNMCCPDCGQAQHPTLEHVLWNCDRYAHLRVNSPPSCPLVRRLGWSHETTVSQSLSLLRQMGKIREAEVINRMQRVRLQHARVIRGGGTAILSGHTKEPSGHTQVNTRSQCEWQWRWRLRLQRLRTLLRTADTWSKCCCVQMQTGAGRVSRIFLSIRVSHLLHVYRLFLHWMTPENAVAFQSSKENRPQKMPARPLEAKIVFVEQSSRLTLGSPSNNVKKSFVRWASHCVVCDPPVETERPARALKKKDVKKSATCVAAS